MKNLLPGRSNEESQVPQTHNAEFVLPYYPKVDSSFAALFQIALDSDPAIVKEPQAVRQQSSAPINTQSQLSPKQFDTLPNRVKIPQFDQQPTMSQSSDVSEAVAQAEPAHALSPADLARRLVSEARDDTATLNIDAFNRA